MMQPVVKLLALVLGFDELLRFYVSSGTIFSLILFFEHFQAIIVFKSSSQCNDIAVSLRLRIAISTNFVGAFSFEYH